MPGKSAAPPDLPLYRRLICDWYSPGLSTLGHNHYRRTAGKGALHELFFTNGMPSDRATSTRQSIRQLRSLPHDLLVSFCIVPRLIVPSRHIINLAKINGYSCCAKVLHLDTYNIIAIFVMSLCPNIKLQPWDNKPNASDKDKDCYYRASPGEKGCHESI